MKLHDNTILITGGGSGIGLALAIEFSRLGNQVIIAGRSEEKLKAAVGANSKLKHFQLDVGNAESLTARLPILRSQFPNLNGVIHSAGIMKNENLKKSDEGIGVSQDTVATNILGTIRSTELLLKSFLDKPYAFIMTVTSGLAYMPLAMTPTYSASKAAIHSYTESLRYQLQGTSIDVLELVPPYVATNLMGDRQAKDPNAMPLEDFTREVMQILKDKPDVKEVTVERVRLQRMASSQGIESYDKFFQEFNDRMLSIRKAEF